MRANPLVSICLLSYNDESYIEEAIKDLLSQDYENIELIISDDASKDRSVEIIKRFANQDDRIRAFYQTKNLGMQGNYNFLLSKVRGDFFCWASSDDRWDKKYISTLLSLMLEDESIVSVGAPYIFIDENGMCRDDVISDVSLRDFEGQSALVRLIKFSFYYLDDFFYGLHRISLAKDVRVPVWWGMNRSIASNCPYPVQAYFLSAGRYKRAESYPLFFKRVNSGSAPRHSAKFNDKPLYSALAFVIRKINVLYETLVSIKKGSSNLTLLILSTPFFTLRFLFDIGSHFAIASRRRIYFFLERIRRGY